MIQQD